MNAYTTTEKIPRLNDCFRRTMAFGGSVMLTTGVACLDGQRKAELQPGARTAWHTHPLGQTLIITAGLGWVQTEGG